MRSHARRLALPLHRALLLTALAVSLGGCVLFNNAKPTPVSQVNLNRQSPRATYEYYKAMAQNNQWAAEWSVFSPNFKRLLNQSVGRNVDSGDYNLARQTVAANNTAEMQMLVNSNWVGVRMVNANTAVATIAAQGRQISPRLVKLTRWELTIRGDDTPYGDFVANAADAVRVGPDGAITVQIRPPQATASLLRTFRPDQIESFKVEAQWYVDDFGGLDATLVQQAGSEPGAQPARTRPVGPQPGAPVRPYSPPPAPGGRGMPAGPTPGGSPDGPPGGYGEPDAAKPAGPQGWGSPDG